MLHAVGDKVPGLSGDSLEHAVLRGQRHSFSMLARDKRVLVWSLIWASLNWLLDAASLWCFVAAFGRSVNPVELFAAYGIANVAGALPDDAGRPGRRRLGGPAAAGRLRRHPQRGDARRDRLAAGQLLAAHPDRRRCRTSR